jgi:hypothetical protein
MSGWWGALLWFAALGYGGYWYYTENEASAGMSGKTFYETCWDYKSRTSGFFEPKPSNPYQAAQWKSCETVVRRGMFGEGMILVGSETGREFDRLRRTCPNLSELPTFYLYIQDTEAAGGLSLALTHFCLRPGVSEAGPRNAGRIATSLLSARPRAASSTR